jgi:hypothetical protein
MIWQGPSSENWFGPKRKPNFWLRGRYQICSKYNFHNPYLYNEEMKDKRWTKIVNATYLWPLLLGPSAFTHGRIESRSIVNLMWASPQFHGANFWAELASTLNGLGLSCKADLILKLYHVYIMLCIVYKTWNT